MTELQGPLYKWLLADRKSPTQRFQWPEDETLWTPNAKPVLCESGWHGMEEKDVLAHLPGVGAVLYEVEVRGEIVSGSDKFAAESMRFKYVIGEATAQKLRLFSCDVAQDVLPIYENYKPNDDRPRKAIEAARAYALDPSDVNKKNAADAASASAAAAAAYAANAAAYVAAAAAAYVAAAYAAAYVADAAAAAAAAAYAAANAAYVADAASAAAAAAYAAANAAANAAYARRAATAKYSNWLIVRIESDQ